VERNARAGETAEADPEFDPRAVVPCALEPPLEACPADEEFEECPPEEDDDEDELWDPPPELPEEDDPPEELLCEPPPPPELEEPEELELLLECWASALEARKNEARRNSVAAHRPESRIRTSQPLANRNNRIVDLHHSATACQRTQQSGKKV
jgi:hypothetical protein